MTHSSLERIAEVIQEVIESEIASQVEDLKAEIADLGAQVDSHEAKNEELVDDERVRELIRDFVNDGGIDVEITAS